MKYCHACGYKLSYGIEKFCPDCGQNLTQEKKEEANGIGITNTTGDVIGTGTTGMGHIIGKEIGYTVQGNVIQLSITGGNISNEIIDSLQKIMNTPTQIDQKSLNKDTTYDRKDIKNELDEISNTQKQITSIIQEVDDIEKKEGTQPIEEIRSENIQTSRKELLLKEHILKGNEYHYKKDYNNAILYFDKALEIDANYIDALNNKGMSLYDLGKHDEGIRCFDMALEIDNSYIKSWTNKGNALFYLGKHDDAIKCYDRALEIDPYNDQIKQNRNISLEKLGKTEK